MPKSESRYLQDLMQPNQIFLSQSSLRVLLVASVSRRTKVQRLLCRDLLGGGDGAEQTDGNHELGDYWTVKEVGVRIDGKREIGQSEHPENRSEFGCMLFG